MTAHRKPAARRSGVAAGPALLGLVLAGTAGTPVSASTQCFTDQIKYTNHGAYSVESVGINWINPGGTKQDMVWWMEGGPSNSGLPNGKSWTAHIAQLGYDIRPGAELWLTIHIMFGDKKSCRKDEHKLIYNNKDGVTMKFESSGTTLNDNNCKYDGNMSKDCYSGD